MRATTLTIAAMSGLGLLLTTACLDTSDPDIGERAASAWVPDWAELWPSPAIEVCFAAYSPSGDPDWNPANGAFMARANQVRTALESALASIPNHAIELYGWNICPPEGLLDGWRISLEDEGNRASADLGYDPNKATGVAVGYDASVGAVVHEFGHALGFHHEFLREDVSPTCTTGTGDGTETGHFLTPYDAASIMNGPYCPGQGYTLTPSDKIAVAFLYPASELPMDVGIRIAFDGGYAVPENLGVTAEYGWVKQGILAEAVHPEHCRLGPYTLSLGQIDAYLAADTPRSLRCWFTDDWGRERRTEPVTIVRSDSKFSSVITALM